MGLDKDGFSRKTYAELLDESHDKYRELFGEDINLSSYTPLGIISRVQAFFYARIWDVVEMVYNSRFIKKADGVSLDYHGGDKLLPRNPALNSYVTLYFEGEAKHTIEMGELYRTEGDVQFMLLDDVQLDDEGKGSGEAVSVDTGAYNNVLPNTITEQVEPDDKVYSVTNPEAASGGADREDDESYRNRLIKANESNGKGTESAVEAALNNTPGVRSARAVFNRTMEVDQDGNPPKSLHAYVLGGNGMDVAESIFESMSGTTQTVGEQEYTVKDISGTPHVIRFDFAETIPIYIKAKPVTNTQFEVDGTQQLQNAFIAVIGGIDLNKQYLPGLSMGEDVILSKLYAAAYKVNGIDDITIEIGIDKNNLETQNINIAAKQVAKTSPENIEVVFNA